MVKIEHAFISMTIHPYTFQKYRGTVKKTIDNRAKTTDYEILTIDGIENNSKEFELLKDIIINDLKQ